MKIATEDISMYLYRQNKIMLKLLKKLEARANVLGIPREGEDLQEAHQMLEASFLLYFYKEDSK
jgi:hypothetical protein